MIEMDRRRVAAAGGLAIAVSATVAAAAIALGGGDQAGGAAAPAGETVPLERRDLSESVTVDGTLGFEDSADVVDRLTGTFTWLPAQGAVIERGRRLFEIDDEPVVLMYGDLPAYRPLAAGDSGEDVEQLESNLAALGFDAGGAMEADDDFDSATASAVAAWQDSLGLEETGEVELGRIVFQRGARRVASVEAGVGDAAEAAGGGSGGATLASNPIAGRRQPQPEAEGEPEPKAAAPEAEEPAPEAQEEEPASAAVTVMTTTSTRRVVTVELDPEDVSEAKIGDPATVSFPGGESAKGRVKSVGAVAEAAASDDAAAGGSGETDPADATIEVTIALPRGRAASKLDAAPVDVALRGDVHRDVFAVPVSALLGIGGGGYAIRAAGDPGAAETTLIPVRPGTFADGYVEIEGEGLREGLAVEIPEQ